jgi:hydrogenase nickel incorporation protein HypB
MCAICGCGEHHEHIHADGTRHSHAHCERHSHAHAHGDRAGHLDLEARVLAKNDALAQANRNWLAERALLAINLMGAPGAGKTLLERTIRSLGAATLSVIEGDQATANDAERIRAAGAAVVQVNTGAGCHLDAGMVARGLEALAPRRATLVVIENVGNLVCPALFQLGERRRVVVLSVTEGDDKPVKYPHMFRGADLVLINKIDLLAHVDFDLDRAIAAARSLRPEVEVLQVSARSGAGLDAWCGWLRRELEGLGDGGQWRLERPGDPVRLEG